MADEDLRKHEPDVLEKKIKTYNLSRLLRIRKSCVEVEAYEQAAVCQRLIEEKQSA